MKELTIAAAESGGRFNKYLQKYLSDAPSSFVYKMLRKKNITLNGAKADGREILQAGDRVKLFLSDETIDKFSKPVPGAVGVTTKPKVNLSMVHEDDQVIFVNKPLNKLSQPDSQDKDSVVYDVQAYLRTPHNATFKPAIANRLDRNTTGLVLCGKTLPALQALNKAIHDKTVDKYYVALVHGRLTQKGTLKNYHQKDTHKNTVKLSTQHKQDSVAIITEYEPIHVFSDYTYVKLKLITGKSHQLRAHMASIGHPIVGDTKYVGKLSKATKLTKQYGIKSQLLHAQQVSFHHMQAPLEHLIGQTFTAPLPKKFAQFLNLLQTQSGFSEASK